MKRYFISHVGILKAISLLLLLTVAGPSAMSQSPSYQQKLYYSCKIWGFIKYFHSEVSNCRVEWDSVLLRTLPLIKDAQTIDAFNDALDTLFAAAGQMELATTPRPDPLPPELRLNQNFLWFNDSLIRADIRAKLNGIDSNYRPHLGCWVKENDQCGEGVGWLAFPKEFPCIDIDAAINFPDEPTRTLLLFKYWNIIEYFDLNRHLADAPWDSTLYHKGVEVVTAEEYMDLYLGLKRFAAALNDAHVSTISYHMPGGGYQPKIILRFIEGHYRAVKSGYPEILPGDRILSINGVSMAKVEDSLRPMISAGTPAAFRSMVCYYIVKGQKGSQIQFEFADSADAVHSLSVSRYSTASNSWFSAYSPSDTLGAVTWRKWGCNVGYVNMRILSVADVPEMYDALKNTRAIIFDNRSYPEDYTIFDIASLMYPEERCFARLTIPDPLYPGSSSWSHEYAGSGSVVEPYTGQVIILSDQETMSAPEYNSMILRAMPNAIVVGSQTAGADGNITQVRLTQDLLTYFTTLGVYYPDGAQTQRIGIVPDSLVLPTADGIRHGRDEVLEKALEITQCPVSTGIGEEPVPVTADNLRLRNYPNPFSISTTLSLSQPMTLPVTLKVYDVYGREIMDLSNRLDGNSSLVLHGGELPSTGMYFCRMQMGQEMVTSSICFVK